MKYQDIPGHPGFQIREDGTVLNLDSGRISRGTPDSHGYLRVQLGSVRRPVHCLLAETFIGSRPVGQVARHLNDIRTDNRLANLAWGTRADNMRDALANGRTPASPGERHWKAKLNDATVRQIRAWLSYGFTQAEISRWFEVNDATVNHVASGRRWSHVI